ncbi:hypothetical protein CesoFtcFv8_025010 [Champsocephalus esox]|uniref:Uncharacterized protein n=1 Tax=Champsocephalus esox TaxID=159716 RepID=A0AAN8B304_9TELE|nr:hypothetical protein CesoFtcFv8_025010 [Champsocephalus esox]
MHVVQQQQQLAPSRICQKELHAGALAALLLHIQDVESVFFSLMFLTLQQHAETQAGKEVLLWALHMT